MCCSEVTHSEVRTCVVQSQNSMFPQNGILYSTVHVHHVLFQTQQNSCTNLHVETDFWRGKNEHNSNICASTQQCFCSLLSMHSAQETFDCNPTASGQQIKTNTTSFSFKASSHISTGAPFVTQTLPIKYHRTISRAENAGCLYMHLIFAELLYKS